VVRSGWFFGLLYLNNNLHYTHHAVPGAPWYRLRGLTESLGAAEVAARGAGTYRGYGEVVRRYGLRPFAQPWHPSALTRRP
jgi:fatty acid desaturase